MKVFGPGIGARLAMWLGLVALGFRYSLVGHRIGGFERMAYWHTAPLFNAACLALQGLAAALLLWDLIRNRKVNAICICVFVASTAVCWLVLQPYVLAEKAV